MAGLVSARPEGLARRFGSARLTRAVAVAAGCAAVMGSGGGRAQAPVPAALTPSGRWTMEYHPEMCVLSRPYASGDGVTTLGIQTATSEETMMLLVVRPAGASGRSRSGVVTVLADGVAVAKKEPYDSRVAPTSDVRVETATLSRDILPALEKATRLAVAFDGKPAVEFALTGTAKALAALTACERDLMVSWGFDMAARAKVAVSARFARTPAAFFGANAYPSDARAAGKTGRTVAVLTVGTDGRVSACRVAVSSKTPSLDNATCDIATRRIVYKPARDASNAPVESQQYLAVRWQLDF